MQKLHSAAAFFLAAFFCVASLNSCSKHGYGVVLWDIDEYALEDGKVIPIYGKSTISKTYIIAAPATREKVEVPQWKIEVKGNFFSALSLAKKHGDYRYLYAKVMFDGLPVRQDSMNTARQLYRLKKDEVIRVLKKGEGAPPTSGGEKLEGDWLEVLANDGTRGWCFSYNLALFDIREENATSLAGKTDGGAGGGSYSLTYGQSNLTEEEMLEKVLSQNWYPDSYGFMLRNSTVDTALFGEHYGFFIDVHAKTIELHFENIDDSFAYKNITKQPSGSYQFDGTSVSMTIRNENHISVLFTDMHGMPASENCTYIEENIDAIISAEKQRRQDALRAIIGGGKEARFSAGNYGSVTFNANGRVNWNDAENLPGLDARALDEYGSARGTAEIKYFLSERMQAYYTGVLTLHFLAETIAETTIEEDETETDDGGSAATTTAAITILDEVNFFYTITADGVDLEDASNAFPSGNVFTDSGASPVIIHLSAN